MLYERILELHILPEIVIHVNSDVSVTLKHYFSVNVSEKATTW
jgi:hypothetical protein